MTSGSSFHVYRDGEEWDSRRFDWTEKLEEVNAKEFGHRSFLPFQREVMNATMSKRDVFALMPPGGGKSLTYQLPALISNGMTLVISPFIHELKQQQADIPITATCFISEMDQSEEKDIFNEPSSLSSKYKILYVTPQVAKSEALLEWLKGLYGREMLTRIVIEEAHCVSMGYDFRQDYLDLGILKQKFPDTPVLALTATATASVEDVVQELGLVSCIVFRPSFDRPNIRFSVIPKRNECEEDIAKFIADNHMGERGIIYCLWRSECEVVAKMLQIYGHNAAFHHWGLSHEECASVQKKWSEGDVDIICQTEAFGMGINKPDVRFVIHHSLPKSIEDYYQDCLRASRDGKPASCVLYYKFRDYIRVKRMIIRNNVARNHVPWATTYTLEKCIEDLHKMVSYSENDADCRRLLLFDHFGEKFNEFTCRNCDTCSKSESNFFPRDVTDIAKQLIDVVRATGQKFSSDYIVKFCRGSMEKAIKDNNHVRHRLHGVGRSWSEAETLRILHHLVVLDYLVVDVTFKYGKHASTLQVNESKATNLDSGCQKIILRFDLNRNVAMYGNPTSALASASRKRDLTHKLFNAIRKLHADLYGEAGEEILKYEQRVLETISATIKEHEGKSSRGSTEIKEHSRKVGSVSTNSSDSPRKKKKYMWG